MNNEDYLRVTSEVNIIINNAASVQFNDWLDLAIWSNTLSTLNLINFAKACPNLIICTHVSTAYVNCNKPGGFIEEKIYEDDITFDIEAFIKQVLAMSIKDIETNQTRLIGDFPNTYTFTKHIGEKLITKYWENVPLVIIRPSIIGNSVVDPCWGWIDSNSAATAIYFAAATGVMQALPGNINTIGDQIPVDYVSNCIIAATAHNAYKKRFKIIHSSSSSINPCTWAMVRKHLYEFGNKVKIVIALR